MIPRDDAAPLHSTSPSMNAHPETAETTTAPIPEVPPMSVTPSPRAASSALPWTPPTSGILTPAVPHWLGVQRIDLDECGSTNDEAARLARAGARHGTVLTASTQTNGRGRAGRLWASPPGGNLYVSMILRPTMSLRDVPAMTLAVGVAVCEVARSFGVPAALKWPNDVLIGGRKVAGVLLESQSRGERVDVVIAGVGVNLSTLPPAELAPIATSMQEHLDAAIDREAFLARMLAAIEHWIDRYIASGLPGIIPTWEAFMAPDLTVKTQREGEQVIGRMEGLDASGRLLLRDERGVLHQVMAGEVETLATPRAVSM